MKLVTIRFCLVAQLALSICGVAAALPAATEEPADDNEGATSVWILRFDLGQSELSDKHRALLDEAAGKLESARHLRLLIVGHSDNLGSEQVNLQVSLQRATVAESYLTQQLGIAEDRIDIEGKGSRKPVASNETADGQRRNRRVAVALQDPSDSYGAEGREVWVLRFGFGDSLLSDGNRAKLDAVAEELRVDPDLEALIVGHSDSLGQEPINLQVSRERAEAAKSYLVRQKGITESRLRARGKGSERPVASNQTVEGQRLNRRVVLALERPAPQPFDEPPANDEATAEPLPVEPQTEVPDVAAEPAVTEQAEPPLLEEAAPPGRDPTAPAAGRRVLLKRGRRVEPPVLIQVPVPVLPDEADSPKQEIPVTIAVLVNEKGQPLVARVENKRLKPRFRKAVVEAAQRASFEPATRDGIAGRMWIDIVVAIPARP